jgi:hypothetical protein
MYIFLATLMAACKKFLQADAGVDSRQMANRETSPVQLHGNQGVLHARKTKMKNYLHMVSWRNKDKKSQVEPAKE